MNKKLPVPVKININLDSILSNETILEDDEILNESKDTFDSFDKKEDKESKIRSNINILKDSR